jgi:hypothetical protein
MGILLNPMPTPSACQEAQDHGFFGGSNLLLSLLGKVSPCRNNKMPMTMDIIVSAMNPTRWTKPIRMLPDETRLKILKMKIESWDPDPPTR